MHIVVVEDEPVIADRVQRLLTEILGRDLNKLQWFDSLDDAEEYIEEQNIDLLMLDLNLNGDDGFDLLKKFAAARFHTIIVSAYSEKAIQAFEYGVIDFVAKPFDKPRLQKALARITDLEQRQNYGLRYLGLKKLGEIKMIEVDSIDYVVADGHYSELCIGETKELHDKSIEKLLALLPPNFERVHRSYIVNMNRVEKIISEEGSKYSLLLQDGRLLPVGRSRYAKIKALLV